MTEKIYEEYAVLDAQIKHLTNQKEELKFKIIEDLQKDDTTTMLTPVGTFTTYAHKTWTYTDEVKQLEEEYKAQKATEQSTGDATFVEKSALRFSQLKI